MKKYAKIVDNHVTDFKYVEPSFFNTFVDSSPGRWVEITDDSISKLGRDPGVGAYYDLFLEIFALPQPYPSWDLNDTTGVWEPPSAKPTTAGKYFDWDEESKSWKEHNKP